MFVVLAGKPGEILLGRSQAHQQVGDGLKSFRNVTRDWSGISGVKRKSISSSGTSPNEQLHIPFEKDLHFIGGYQCLDYAGAECAVNYFISLLEMTIQGVHLARNVLDPVHLRSPILCRKSDPFFFRFFG